MPHNSKSVATLPKKVLILGSGGLKIGQAGEFDYSGTQAIKAFKEEGIEVVLLNPNIATVQTDNTLADRVYFLPLTLPYAKEVIEQEQPDAIALSFGGQTALNLGLELEKTGVLKKYAITVLGTSTDTIQLTEDRKLFAQALKKINVNTARSVATHSVSEALKAAEAIGYPVMMRSGFALGGEGSGKVLNKTDLEEKAKEVFNSVSQILIEEYLGGWKEVEYEVVRDRADNCITVCNMENFDPMGIHTGESIVVAPSQTLTNYQYHMLREVALNTIRHLGIIGECNIQYALDPNSNEYRVIEVNARLSRSSALASKATGYPLAFVAAKLALGATLPELQNSITKSTSACFEPALDYVVIKIPRWDLQKFDGAETKIGTEMKSVGEVMAIGRSFEEALQKAIRSLNIGADGLIANEKPDFNIKETKLHITTPTASRLFALALELARGTSVDKLHQLSKIDVWFLTKLQNITTTASSLRKSNVTKSNLRSAKQCGFSDKQIAFLTKSTEMKVRALRKRHQILPVVKQIDTLAGEFPARTNYLYLTYHGNESDLQPHNTLNPNQKQFLVIGSGPYCIGSSVEFDWSCVQVLNTLAERSHATAIINSNPETVSTDYDVSDRLYFEELTLERVLDIYDYETSAGVIISTGGQIANNLALPLFKADVPVLGTKPTDIDRAEDRNIFSQLLDSVGVEQPAWTEVSSIEAAVTKTKAFGFPVLVRPSYVLSGAAMSIVYNVASLRKALGKAADISKEHPVVISKFIENSREIEIDGVAQDGHLMIYAISEHIENAGTHSGDATVVLPPQRTYLETIRRAKTITKGVVSALNITGPFNIQFLAKDNELQVIECNVRASRSFPFVSKVTGHNFIALATRALLGESIAGDYNTLDFDHVGVKSPQFSYNRIKGADPLGYVEMNSTGEVACIEDSYHQALLESMVAAGMRIPKKHILVSLGKTPNKVKLLPSIKILAKLGYTLYATEHTADFLQEAGVKCKKVHKIHTKRNPNVNELLDGKKLDLIINIPAEALAREPKDGFIVRRRAIDNNIPLITNRQLAEAFVAALADAENKLQ